MWLFAMLALAAAFTGADAQRIGANAVVLTSAHQPLGSPLVGGELALRAGGRDSTVSLIVAVASMRGRSDRIGSPCGGFSPPTADCTDRPLRDDGRVTAGSIGAALPVLRAGRVRLSITGDVTLGRFHVESRPISGGATLVAEKLMVGAYLGAMAAWSPSMRAPLAIEASIAAGGFRPVHQQEVLDAYAPFEAGFDARRMSVGLSWRVR
jgi:hypothetical protein